MKSVDFSPEMFGGSYDAYALVSDLAYISHLWDDLIDKDVDRGEYDICLAFEKALVSIPANPFYRQHFDQLHPLIYSGVIAYMTANMMEADGDEHGIEIAHGLRYAVANVAAYIVYNTNPKHRALSILADAWKKWMPERFEDYKKEHHHE